MRLRPIFLLPAVAALSLAAGIGYAAYERIDTSAVEANADLLASVPTYPGAREIDRRSDTSAAGDLPLPEGVLTTVLFRPPDDATQEDVLDFYVSRLKGWRARTSAAQNAYRAELSRGDDCLVLLTNGMTPGHVGARSFALAAQANEGGC